MSAIFLDILVTHITSFNLILIISIYFSIPLAPMAFYRHELLFFAFFPVNIAKKRECMIVSILYTQTRILFLFALPGLPFSVQKLITLHNNFIILLLVFFSILLARTAYFWHKLLNYVNFNLNFSVPSSYASSPLPSSAV